MTDDGYGPADRQILSARAGDAVLDAYRLEHPEDSMQDAAAASYERMVGAATYALGDSDLPAMSGALVEARDRLVAARDYAMMVREQLLGAVVAAGLEGVPVEMIADLAHMTVEDVEKLVAP